MKIAAVFAGQGAQTIGMGRDLYEAHSECRGIFAKANSVLGFDITKVCFEGPAEDLLKTSNCQPAIFTVSVACLEALKLRRPDLAFTAAAGLSLGEWTALYAAGVITFEQGVRILEARGRAMQEACEEQQTGMVSVMKLPYSKIEEICAKSGAVMANINSEEQIVLSGTSAQVTAAEKLTAEAGGRAVVLNVAGAYHSPFMASASLKLARVLSIENFSAPQFPVYSNVTGKPHSNPDSIRAEMVAQVTAPVRWMDTVKNISAAGADAFIEFGPGKALTGLIKRISKDAAAMNVSGVEQVASVAESI